MSTMKRDNENSSLENDLTQVSRYTPINSTFRSPARKGTQVHGQTGLHSGS